jgi:hypothetical protein
MKKSLLLSCSLSLALSLPAQTTAMDWTRTECVTGQSHHLFSELDSGYVVILEFVMMSCAPCIGASHGIDNIRAPFEQSHPGKVRAYAVGFTNSTTCAQMINWKTVNNITHKIFEKGAAEVTYYGGMGMPTIVVLGGGTQHKVYYSNQGFTPTEIPLIGAAIELAIAESSSSGASNLLDKTQFQTFPNPFENAITVEIRDVEATHLTLTDLTGKEILRQDIDASSGSATVLVPTEEVRPGLYLVALYRGQQQLGLQKLVKE